jgi:nicotinate-nucleotide pyrophosphorylase (carboxylating)
VGSARTILAVERSALNALQRLSGIATYTHRTIVAVDKRVVIAATRKTAWGGLDKRAVAHGGGLTHRLHLGDSVMVKDNHLVLLEHDTLQRARFGRLHASLEVASLAALKRAVIHYPQFTILLLDNFSPERLRLAMHWLDQQKLRRRYIVEASGGISPDNLSQYAKTGVDILSLGALTHSAAALDLSLDIMP